MPIALPGRGVSLWLDSSNAPHRPPLTEDADCDVCVIGAGIAGLTAALALARGGAVCELERPKGLLLGADDAAVYQVLTSRLRTEDLILFYTDGLVERRSASTDVMLERVKQALAEVSADPGPHPLTHLRGLLHFASPDDDTCTLALRVCPDGPLS